MRSHEEHLRSRVPKNQRIISQTLHAQIEKHQVDFVEHIQHYSDGGKHEKDRDSDEMESMMTSRAMFYKNKNAKSVEDNIDSWTRIVLL